MKPSQRVLLGALIACLVTLGFIGCAVVTLRTNFGVSAQDKARTKLLAEQAILGARPDGFLRRGTSSNAGSPQIFFGGGASDNEASAIDTITIPSITAAGQLLRMAQADGWVITGDECHPEDDRYAFSGFKRISSFIARLDVQVAGDDPDGYPKEPQSSVEVSAHHHRFDNRYVVEEPAPPGCLATHTPASVPVLHGALPDGNATNLSRIDLATGRRVWSVPCDPDNDRTVFAFGARTLTSCDSVMQVRDTKGKVTCTPDEDELRRYAGDVLAVRNPDLFVSHGSDPTRAFDLTCKKRWEATKGEFGSDRLQSVADGFLLAARSEDNNDTLLRLDQGSGRTLWSHQGRGRGFLVSGVLVTVVDARLTGVDPATGRKVWQQADFVSGAVRAAGSDFVVSGGEELIAVFDAATGMKRLQQLAPEDLVSIEVASDRLLLRTSNTISVMSASDGREFAVIAIPPTAQARTTTDGVALLSGGTLRWYDSTGRETWSTPVTGLSRTVVVDPASHTVLVVDGTNKLIARDTRTGATRWTSEINGVGAAPVVSGDGVFVRTR